VPQCSHTRFSDFHPYFPAQLILVLMHSRIYRKILSHVLILIFSSLAQRDNGGAVDERQLSGFCAWDQSGGCVGAWYCLHCCMQIDA
jgi:hypothetical protein